MIYLILDTETNGIGTFRPARQRLVQFSWILYNEKNNKIVEHNYFINGVKEISDHVPHSITVEYLNKNGISFNEAYNKFKKDIEVADVIVAHNYMFDIGIIRNEMKLNNITENEREYIKYKKSLCTMKSLTSYCNILMKKKDGSFSKHIKWPSLCELYQKLFNKLPEEQLHDSLDDCRVLLKCFKKCRILKLI